MDPISAIGDERRRMVENTQRSNSSLHAQTVKRHRDRIKRGSVGSSYRAGETADDFDGDFMAGDDDELDDSGGGGNAELFRQMWEDDVEANLPEPMAGDTIFEEVESSGLLGHSSGYSGAGDYSDEDSIRPPLAAICPDDVSPEGECTSVLELSAAASPIRSTASEEESPEFQGSAGEDSRGVARAGRTARENGQAEHAGELGQRGTSPDATEPGSIPTDGRAAGLAGAANKGESEPSALGEGSEPDESAPPLEHISMGAVMAEIFGGLDAFLTGSDGAIHLDGQADIMQLISAPASNASLPRAALPPVSADIGQILDKLIIGCTHSEQLERLRSLLGRFGKGVLSCCLARGTKVHVVPPGQLAGVDILRGTANAADICGGLYSASNRTCYLDEQTISEVPQGVNPVIFFMAQAWDHALGEDDFASLHAPAVLANFEACRMALEGHSFSDSLVAISPVMYFAQAVEAYLAENDCDNELWNREDLYDLDRSMYDYVEYLFKQGNK